MGQFTQSNLVLLPWLSSTVQMSPKRPLAMITRFSSISTRKLSSAMNVITQNKSMVATSDYDDFHKMVKRHAITGALGTNALTLGDNIESVHIKELGTAFSQEEMHRVLVTDIMEAAIEVDWIDFFPYLSWIPNKGFETRVQHIHSRRIATVKALQQERFTFLSTIKSKRKLPLIDSAISCKIYWPCMLIWEYIGEASSDTVATTAEWAMYELAKNSTHQLRLFNEIRRICGENKITEEDMPHLPYLNAVFHETLRKYSPAGTS
ncbi:hypothetical protein QQ045_014494 [Rhodiola kirilowii]